MSYVTLTETEDVLKNGGEEFLLIAETEEIHHSDYRFNHFKSPRRRFCTHDLGVNSLISKTVSFTAPVELMKAITKYWFEIVELPEASSC